MNTAQDLVDYLLTSSGGGAQDGEHKVVRQAIIHGVREVMQIRDWLWHTKTNFFTTNQISTTVTITAGSNQVTAADATGMVVGRILEVPPQYFPTTVRITAVSGNTVTLDHVAAISASGITVFPQTYYDLPADLKDVDALVTNTVGTLHCYITPQEWQRLEINTRGAGEPYYYTVMRSDTNPDRYQVRFVGVPTNSTVVHYTYRYTPKTIKYMGYERLCRQGTVESSGTAVTGTGTAFPEDIAGSVIRFGTPTSEADPIGSLQPFIAERKIASRVSSTAMTIDAAATAAALTKYSISDPIDASPQMYTAILSACDMWYARLAGKPADVPSVVFQRDLKIAMENDVVSPMSGRPSRVVAGTARTQGWHSPILPDLT
jgi:hypothetical protein